MRILIIIFCFILPLTACNKEKIKEEHVTYIDNLGWTIESFELNRQETVEIVKDTIENYRAANINFIENYEGKELNVTRYKLKEKDLEGDNILVDLYEYEGNIVGAIGILTNTTPGIFNFTDVEKKNIH